MAAQKKPGRVAWEVFAAGLLVGALLAGIMLRPPDFSTVTVSGPTPRPTPLGTPKPDTLSELALSIVYEENGCEGENICPAFSLWINAGKTGDGRVEYEGGSMICTAGKAGGAISRAHVDALAAEIVRSGFFDLDDYLTYSAETDGPTASLRAAVGGRSHVLRYYGRPDHPVSDIVRDIYGYTDAGRWTGDCSNEQKLDTFFHPATPPPE